MKTSILKKIFTYSLFLLFATSLNAQKPKDYNEEDFKRDVETFKDFDRLYSYYYAQYKVDSIHFMLEEYMPLMERAYKFRPTDTTIVAIYKYAKVVYGVSMTSYLGEIETGLKKAVEAYEDAWNDPLVNGDYRLATTANVLAGIFKSIGDQEKMLWYAQRSMEIKQKLYKNDHPMMASQYVIFGDLYHSFEEFDRAEYYYLKAREVNKRRYGKNGDGVSIKLAWNYIAQDRIDTSLQILKDKISIYEDKNKTQSANYYAHSAALCRMYLELGFYHKAKNELLKYIRVLQNNPLYFDYKDHHVAPSTDSLRRYRIPTYDRLAGAYYLLARSEYFLTNYRQAIHFFQKSLEIDNMIRGEHSFRLREIMKTMSLAYAHLGDYSKAEIAWEKGLPRSALHLKNIKFDTPLSLDNLLGTSSIIEFLFIKAQIAQIRMKDDPAYAEVVLHTYETIGLLIDNMSNRLGKGTMNLVELKKVVKKYYEEGILFFIKQYEKNQNIKYFNQAFRFMESSKATTLLSSLASSNAQQFYRVSQDLLNREKETNLYLNFTEKLILEEEGKGNKFDPKKLLDLNRNLNNLKGRKDSIIQVLRKKYPKYYHYNYQNKALSLQEVQSFLEKENRAVLEYFLGQKYLFTFLICPDRVEYEVDLIEDLDLPKLVNQFLTPVKSPDFRNQNEELKAFSKVGGELFRILHLNLLDKAGLNNFLIIPDGLLYLLPFHLLPYQTNTYGMKSYAKYPYLFKKYITSTEYSTGLHILSENQKRKIKNTYLGFAPKYRSGSRLLGLTEEDNAIWRGRFPLISREGVDSLHFNREEVLECSEILGGKSFINEQAREYEFKNNGAKAGILHMAMHAFLDNVNPLYSRLAFNLEGEQGSEEDGLLYAYELYNTQLNADLTILSACNTGVGKISKGEGVVSLSHAFKYAGSPNVVLNYWPANDKSAKDLVVSFARQLKSGKGKAEALNEARKEYLANAPESAQHPYFWAGLTLIGDDDPIAKKGISKWIFFIAALFIIVCMRAYFKSGKDKFTFG